MGTHQAYVPNHRFSSRLQRGIWGDGGKKAQVGTIAHDGDTLSSYACALHLHQSIRFVSGYNMIGKTAREFLEPY